MTEHTHVIPGTTPDEALLPDSRRPRRPGSGYAGCPCRRRGAAHDPGRATGGPSRERPG